MNVFTKKKLRKFADDTKLGQRAGTTQERESMQEALDHLCQWADTWGMQFNVGKCKVMHFGVSDPYRPRYDISNGKIRIRIRIMPKNKSPFSPKCLWH